MECPKNEMGINIGNTAKDLCILYIPKAKTLGAFEFKGAFTAGDGSCDTGSKSMGTGFCNLGQLGWNTQTPLPPSVLHEQRTRNSRKVGREEKKGFRV
jgi:hypothetical protein